MSISPQLRASARPTLLFHLRPSHPLAFSKSVKALAASNGTVSTATPVPSRVDASHHSLQTSYDDNNFIQHQPHNNPPWPQEQLTSQTQQRQNQEQSRLVGLRNVLPSYGSFYCRPVAFPPTGRFLMHPDRALFDPPLPFSFFLCFFYIAGRGVSTLTPSRSGHAVRRAHHTSFAISVL